MRIAVEPEHELLRDALNARAMTSVRPLADHMDRRQAFSWDLWAAVRDLGLTRLPFPEIRQIIVSRELLARGGS
jgi:alkylation response protein AidB-like acyl-CoA dehydrogenase